MTNAVKSYAEYEQLVGGVETLFKDSNDVVMKYAANAYKTAGLSANAYMETVTSFSASLLQGLGGDTEEAAKIADLAITDMADNANKMGTDIRSIQDAYQGFAKQNYTMLDNLKLGYGGTQSEMIRLINDSGILGEKISSLDNVSFDQMIEAIHVVQTNMGITGTTAKESSSTISGSVNAAKSAWENLVIGIADDNQDFENLVNDFVESVGVAAENIIPRVEIAINGTGQLIESLLPIIVDRIPEIVNNILPELIQSGINMVFALLEGVQQNFSQVTNGAMMIINQFVETLSQMLPMIVEMGLQLIVQLALGIAQALPELVPEVINVVLQIADTLINNIDLLIEAALQLIIGLAEGLINALPILIEKVPVIISNLCDAFSKNAGTLARAAVELIIILAAGLIRNIPTLIKNVPKIVKALTDAFTVGFKSIFKIGENIVKGIWSGISDGWDWLKKKVKDLAEDLLDSAKDALGIHSPSKKFKWIGQMCVEGFEEPLEEYNPYETLNTSMKANVGTMQAEFSSRNDVSSSIDYDLLGYSFAKAMCDVGVTMDLDGRTIGRIMRSYA